MINSDSSSLKFSLFDMTRENEIMLGSADRLNTRNAELTSVCLGLVRTGQVPPTRAPALRIRYIQGH
ncbi:hypothetical protein [Saccharospirillum sp.]|uniref:hypothetical protein n=1 Tax=Saccharospirillum sp. TaxID=2033801 RepID=UPI0034A0813C